MPSKSFTGSSAASIDVLDAGLLNVDASTHHYQRCFPSSLLMSRTRPNSRWRDQDVLVQMFLYEVNKF